MTSPRDGEKGVVSPRCWCPFPPSWRARMAFDSIQRPPPAPPSAVSVLNLIDICTHVLPPWTVEPRFPPPLSLLVSLVFLRPHPSKAPLSWPPPIIRFDRHQRETLLCEGHARLGGENLLCAPAQPGSGIDRDWQQHVFQHCLSRLSPQGRPLVRYHDSDAVDVVVTRESTQGDRQNTSSCSPPFPSLHPYLCHSNLPHSRWQCRDRSISPRGDFQSGKHPTGFVYTQKVANLTTSLDCHHTFPPLPKDSFLAP